MPLDSKSSGMLKRFESEYGDAAGKRNFYATLNKRINEGRPVKVGESKHLADKRKNKRGTRKAKRARRR